MTNEAYAFLGAADNASFPATAARYGMDCVGPAKSGAFLVKDETGQAWLFGSLQGMKFKVRVSMKTVWSADNLAHFKAEGN